MSSELLQQPSFDAAGLNRLLDRMVDIVCLINADGTIVFINHAASVLLGYQREEMLGESLLKFVRPEDHDRSQQALNELPTDRNLSYFRNTMRSKLGDIIEVEWYTTWDQERQLVLSIGKNLSVHQRPASIYHLPASGLPGTSLSQIELFRGISREDLIRMEEASSERLVRKGEALRFPQFSNKYAYLLVQGVMKTVTTHTAGKELIKFLVRPVNLVGDIPILEQYERPSNYAIALKDSTVILLDMSLVMDWFYRYEFFRIRLKQQVAARIHRMEDRLSAVIHKTASERVAGFLAEFAKEFGTADETGWTVQNFLTHGDVAQLTSVSRQKASQVFSRLKRNKWIDYNKQHIWVKHNSPLFKKITGLD